MTFWDAVQQVSKPGEEDSGAAVVFETSKRTRLCTRRMRRRRGVSEQAAIVLKGVLQAVQGAARAASRGTDVGRQIQH